MIAAPAVGTSVGAVLGAAVALYPGQLPRTATLAGVLLAVCVGLGAFAGMGVARLAGPGSGRARRWALCASGGSFGLLVAAATWWQHSLRSTLGTSDVGVGWAATTALPAVVLCTAIALRPRLVAWSSALAAAVLVGYLSPGLAGAQPSARVAASDRAFYGPLAADRSAEQRAHDVVARWVAAGGLSRRAVVVAVPTGSGWIDAAAVEGFRTRFDGDVSVLGLQYAAVSSWRAFVTDRDAAGRSAIALVAELDAALRTVDSDRRPALLLYGQSLGAVGADAARAWAQAHGVEVAQTIEVGVPADSVPRAAPNRTVLANATDPVTRWSPNLLWRPPLRPDDTRVIGRPRPAMPWLPVITFVQTTVDLLGALDVPAGAGHRYGAEQGLAW